MFRSVVGVCAAHRVFKTIQPGGGGGRGGEGRCPSPFKTVLKPPGATPTTNTQIVNNYRPDCFQSSEGNHAFDGVAPGTADRLQPLLVKNYVKSTNNIKHKLRISLHVDATTYDGESSEVGIASTPRTGDSFYIPMQAWRKERPRSHRDLQDTPTTKH